MLANVPYSLEQYLALLRTMNQALWPAFFVAYTLGLAAVILAWLPRPWASRAVAGILALFWLAGGLVYQLAYLTKLFPAAYVFTGLFVLQALLLAWEGVVRGRLEFAPRKDGFMVMGGLALLLALVGHPLLSAYLGHPWPLMALLGLTPCPTVIFTLGMLLWTKGRLPKHLLAVPVLWSFLGFILAVELGLREDVVLLVAGLASASLLLPRDLKLAS